MFRLGMWLLCGLTLFAQVQTAEADALSSQTLYSRPSVRSPSLSPSGTRLAIVGDTGHDQNSLVIFSLDGTTLKPILKTAVPGLVDVDAYHWISDDVLLMWIDVGAGDGAVWAMLDINKGVLVQLKHKFAKLLQDHWGDADHVLIWDLCEVDKMCVYNWNISIDNGVVYANALSNAQGARLRMQGKEHVIAELHGSGDQIEQLMWDPAAHNWVPVGTTLAGPPDRAVSGPNAERFEALRARTPDIRPVETAGTQEVVGASTPPPGPAFLPFVSALRAPADSLAASAPSQRLYWSGISDDLQHALITQKAIGQPPAFLIWSNGKGAVEFARSHPDIDAARLGPVSIENDWFDDGAPVAVTKPPAGVPVSSVLLIPELASGAEARERFVDFDPQTQALAQHGILSVRVQLPYADERGLHNQAWRDAVAQRLTRAAEHVRKSGLSATAKTCVGGTFESGYAALSAAAANPEQFACVFAINLPFKTEFLAKPILVQAMRGHTSREWNMTGSVRRWVAMEGENGDPTGWVSRLPSHVLLVYDMSWNSFGQAIKPHADAFIGDMKKSGKTVQVYAPDTDFDQAPKWNATMSDALATFLQ